MKEIAACAGLCLIWALPAGSQEVHSHPPPEKLGRVSFPTSCVARVAHDLRAGNRPVVGQTIVFRGLSCLAQQQ